MKESFEGIATNEKAKGTITRNGDPSSVSYEYFDPRQELKKIRTFSKNKSGQSSHEEYLSKKRDLLESYNKQLAEQMMGVSKLHAELEEILFTQEKYDEECEKKLREHIEENAEKLKLSPKQLSRYEVLFDYLSEWNAGMDFRQEDFELGVDDREFFKELFGEFPVGEVIITRTPVSFCVECKNLEDYAFAMGESKKSANLSGGCSFGKITLVANYNRKNPETIKKTKIHEQRHSLKKIFDNVQLGLFSENFHILQARLADGINIEEKVKKIRVNATEMVQDEIFAYLKDSSAIETIREILSAEKSENGLYDYIESSREKYHNAYKKGRLGENFDMEAIDRLFDLEKKKYLETINEALDVVEKMEYLGMTRGEIISLLEFEPLDKWRHKAVRLEKGGKFVESRKNKLEEYPERVKKLEDELEAKSQLVKMALLESEKYPEYLTRINFEMEKRELDEMENDMYIFKKKSEKFLEPFN
jgi:hypothetical protein